MKVVYAGSDMLQFEDGSTIYSDHDQDCCEHHYLDFSGTPLNEFEGLDFNLSIPDLLFEKVEDYGIRLIPTNGHPISIPGYGVNNGYYSANLTLVLKRPKSTTKIDITDCQKISD